MKSLIPTTRVSLLLVQGTIVAVLLVLLACQTGGREIKYVEVQHTSDATPTHARPPAPTSTSTPAPAPPAVLTPTPTSTPAFDIAKLKAGIGAMYDCINAHQELRDSFQAALVNELMHEAHIERSTAEATVDTLLDSRLMYTKVMVSYVSNNPTDGDDFIVLASIPEKYMEATCADLAAESRSGEKLW